MAGYFPQQPPTVESFQDLAEWIFRELLAVSAALQAADEVVLPEQHVEPDRPQLGQVALADGADWDPGFDQGVYFWNGAAWELLGPGPGNINTTLDNVMLGDQAGVGLTTGTDNTLVGDRAGEAITEGAHNTVIGSLAGLLLTIGIDNTIIGSEAGRSLTSGSEHTLVGRSAGEGITTGIKNTLIGADNGEVIDTGSNNSALGHECLHAATSASDNVVVGTFAAGVLTTGNRNTVLGANAGAAMTVADDCVYLGRSCADNATSGHDNIVIGAGLDLENADDAQKLIIGNLIFGLLGVGNQGTTIPAGGIGIGVRAPTVRLHVDGPVRVKDYATGSLPSALSAGIGAMAYDSTLDRLVVSNGSAWQTIALEP